jgi:phage tail protein X
MAIWYQCRDGDELDAICFDYYGFSRGSVEQVLAHEQNRELAEKLPILEVGDSVYLPDIARPSFTPQTGIWG